MAKFNLEAKTSKHMQEMEQRKRLISATPQHTEDIVLSEKHAFSNNNVKTKSSTNFSTESYEIEEDLSSRNPDNDKNLKEGNAGPSKMKRGGKLI